MIRGEGAANITHSCKESVVFVLFPFPPRPLLPQALLGAPCQQIISVSFGQSLSSEEHLSVWTLCSIQHEYI